MPYNIKYIIYYYNKEYKYNYTNDIDINNPRNKL